MNRRRAAAIVAAGLILRPAPSRAQAAPYKIGVTWPNTGPLAAISGEFSKGSIIAVNDVNRTGGVHGRPLQLIIEDTQGTPQGGIAAMRKLVQVDRVPVIMTNYTNVVTAQIPLAEELRVPAISNIETPGLFAKSEYSFSHAPTWGTTLPLMGKYWKLHGIKRVYGLLTNTSMGQLQSPALRAMVAEMGGEYGEAMLDPASIDYRGAIARARETNPEVLMITGQGSTAESVVVKQAREMGMTTPVWAFSAAYQGKAFRDALGPYGEGMVMGGIYLDPNDPVTKPFAKSYRAELGYIPGYPVGEFYDDVKILAHVIGTVGYDAEAIRAALTTLKGVPSVLGGTITMGPDHYTRFSNLGLWKVKAGKLVRLT